MVSETHILPLDAFNVIDEQQLFLRSDFNLIDLQNMLETDFISLTTSIHYHFDSTFLDYIKQKRVTYVKGKILDGTLKSTDDISRLIGDGKSFSNDYARMYGTTPEELFESQNRLIELKELLKAYEYDVSAL